MRHAFSRPISWSLLESLELLLSSFLTAAEVGRVESFTAMRRKKHLEAFAASHVDDSLLSSSEKQADGETTQMGEVIMESFRSARDERQSSRRCTRGLACLINGNI